MNFAIGWACTLKDMFYKFPIEKCKYICETHKWKSQRFVLVFKIFRECIRVILDDIVENNVTFKLPSFGYYKGELHYEIVEGEDFRKAYLKGKFKGIDFLETIFTGYLLYLYVGTKGDMFSRRRKFPVYVSNKLKRKFYNYINQGKQYC